MGYSQPITGMDQDVSPKFQAPGTYRYAQNATVESIDPQHTGSISVEQGNAICGSLNLTGAKLCGSVQLDDHTFLLFITTDDDSRIAIYDPKSCVVDNIMITPVSGSFGDCLNFNPLYPVRAEFRVREGCKRFVYFTDDYNPMRAINIDDIPQYLVGAEIDCSLFTHTPTVESIPRFDRARVRNSGGFNVPVGTVQFAARLITVDGAVTNWLHVSQSVPITAPNFNQGFHNIHGSSNEDPILFSNVPGQVPLTNKSVQLNVSNIDTRFEQIQFASILSSGSLGVADDAYSHDPVPITSDSMDWLWTGISADATQVAIDDIIVDSAIIDKVKDLDQIDNRMPLANVSQKIYDWAPVQQAANDISSEWIEIEFQYQLLEEGASKGDLYYFNRRSYMRDEIYAFGIRGRLKLGGGYTPVFHIPGRESDILTAGEIANANAESHYRIPLSSGTSWDTELLTVADPVTVPASEVELDNVRHLGFANVGDDIGDGAGKVQRWKVFNTAATKGTDTDSELGTYTYGHMSYWESEEDYPDQLDCDNNRIYPTGKVRHHKFPDTTLRPAWEGNDPNDGFSGSVVRPIGIRFDTTAFEAAIPAEILEDVLCWEIVRVPRDGGNITVLDKGYIQNAPDAENDFYYDPGDPNPNCCPINPNEYHDEVVSFDSAKTLLTREPLNADYYKVERVYTNFTLHTENFGYGYDDLYGTNFIYYFFMNRDQEGNLEARTDYNRSINNSIYLDYARPYFSTDQKLTPGKPTIKDEIDGFEVGNNWYSIPRYMSAIEGTKTLEGDPWGPLEDEIYQLYVSYKKHIPSMYFSLPSLIYFSVDNGCDYSPNDIVFGGDVFISRWNYTTLPTIIDVNDINLIFPNTLGPHLFDIFTESTVNASLRTEDTTGQATSSFVYGESFFDYMVDRDVLPDPAIGTIPEIEYRDFLEYNPDYSKENKEKPDFPLSSLYDFCEICNNTHPFRLLYSERSYQEDTFDNYRIFLPNNYRDLEGETGEITTLFVQKDELYATTNKATYHIPIRPQTLQTNETSAFIGIGDVLSVPPKRLLTSDYSFGGCVDPETLITTEHGTFWADGFSGKVFHLTDGLGVITTGMKSFFEENLELKIAVELRNLLNVEWPQRSTLDQLYSAGLFAGYDPTINTYYLHKKDYKILNPNDLELWHVLQPVDQFVYDSELNRFGVSNGDGTYDSIPLTDTDYFIDLSWNISYHVPSQAWISFHSWMPNYMFNSEDRLFTHKKSLNDQTFDIWAQRTGRYGSFWDADRGFILELIFNQDPNRTKVFKNMSVVMDMMSYDEDKKQWYYLSDQTFSNVTFYTDDQSTDEQRVVIKDAISYFDGTEYNAGVIRADRTTDQWNFNEFRDQVVTHNTAPLWSSSPDDGVNTSQGYSYIDKVPNPDIMDIDKSIFETGRLRGEWLGARLRWQQDFIENYKISINVAESMEKYDMRDFKPSFRDPRAQERR